MDLETFRIMLQQNPDVRKELMDQALARSKVQKGLQEVRNAILNNDSKKIIRQYKAVSKQQ
jgi:ribosomal protein L7Ae-like RNA K-turn-binding protein